MEVEIEKSQERFEEKWKVYKVEKFSEREMVERIEALLTGKNGEDKIGNKIAKWCVKYDDRIR